MSSWKISECRFRWQKTAQTFLIFYGQLQENASAVNYGGDEWASC